MGRVIIQDMDKYHELIQNLKEWNYKLRHIDLSAIIQRLYDKGSVTPNQCRLLKRLKKEWKYESWILDLKGLVDVESEEGREQILYMYIDDIIDFYKYLTPKQDSIVTRFVADEIGFVSFNN